MSKKFGEPDKEKNTLSISEEELDKISGGTSVKQNWSDILKKIKEKDEKNTKE
ncbi:MAG: hypothetical protein LBI55_00725 [Oscillospiraceae bacterium]|jgi:hypothetical protein|nr:hypothetical protein [Oscillospiraceae bacterium]